MKLLQDNKLWEDDNLISQASEKFGNSQVIAALKQKSLTNNNVKAYLAAVESYQN